MSDLKQECLTLLNQRGVTFEDLAECVVFLQKPYHPEITSKAVMPSLHAILGKREVQHAILTGISLDLAAEADQLPKTLNALLRQDEALYGVDEVLAYGICNLYGSIALTNYGYLDRVKPGVIGRLNNAKGRCHTFLDDIVGAIAASAASRMAHTSEE